jgi:hypothetical protein
MTQQFVKRFSLKRVVGYLFLSDGTPSHRQGPPVKTWSG